MIFPIGIFIIRNETKHDMYIVIPRGSGLIWKGGLIWKQRRPRITPLWLIRKATGDIRGTVGKTQQNNGRPDDNKKLGTGYSIMLSLLTSVRPEDFKERLIKRFTAVSGIRRRLQWDVWIRKRACCS